MTSLLESLLAKRDWLLADGATGTNLFALGLCHGDAPELWNLEEPAKIRTHYRSFIEAGSDIVLTNTFGGTANRLKLHAADDRVHEINAAAARLLKEEIAASGGGRPIVCAGSVGPTGDLMEPLGPLSMEGAISAFSAQMEGLKEGGADVVWIETMSSKEETAAALTAAARVGLQAVCTLSFDTNGRTMMGITAGDLAGLAHDHQHQPIAYGGNCGTGASDLMVSLLSLEGASKPEDVIIAKANAGIPVFADGEIRYNGTPELMADYAVLARDAGARIIGGCCGTTPEHVRAMRTALATRPVGERPSVERVIELLGPLTGKTSDLLNAPSEEEAAEPARGRGRRRARSA